MDGTCFSDRTLEIDAINMRRKASPHSANLGVHGNSTSSGVSSAHPSQSHHQGQQPGKQKQIEREQESAVRDDQHQQPGKQKHPQKEQEPAVRDEVLVICISRGSLSAFQAQFWTVLLLC